MGPPGAAQVGQCVSSNSSANVRRDTFNKNIGVNYVEGMSHTRKNTYYLEKHYLYSEIDALELMINY